MPLQTFERETVIGWDDSSTKGTIVTFNKALIKKLDNYCKDHPKEYKLTQEIYFDKVLEGKEYSFPKKLITIRTPNKRKMTDEQKLAASERMKKMKKEKAKEKDVKEKEQKK